MVPPVQAAASGEHVPTAEALAADLRRRCGSVLVLDALGLAQRAGNAGALNAVMLGALSCLPQCPVSDAELLAAILAQGSPRAHVFNERAFALGREAIGPALERAS